MRQTRPRTAYFTILILLSLSFLTPYPARADSRDDEISALKEQVQALLKRIEKLEAAQKTENVPARPSEQAQPAAATAGNTPQWLDNLRLKGDVRLRYEFQADKGNKNYHRMKIRARAGILADINDRMKAAIGIATGRAGDPRSTNVTIGNSSSANTPASFKDIVLDYAYGSYSPFEWLTVTGGKFHHPLWLPADMLWDTDINPEGAALTLNYTARPGIRLFANNLFFMLRNDGRTTSKAFMCAFQPGAELALSETVALKAAATYYCMNPVKDKARFSNQASNTLVNGDYKYDYGVIDAAAELRIKEPLGGVVPHVALFGDYVRNVYATKGRSGFDAGIRFGHEKTKALGQWQAKVVYIMLERDAWPDIFPDSSRYGGRTNIRGLDCAFQLGIAKNSSLAAHYYFYESLTAPFAPQHLLQVDWSWSF